MFNKALMFIAIWVIYLIMVNIFYINTMNDAMTNQFQNNGYSTSLYNLVHVLWAISWIAPVVASCTLFDTSIKKFIKLLKEIIRNEKK